MEMNKTYDSEAAKCRSKRKTSRERPKSAQPLKAQDIKERTVVFKKIVAFRTKIYLVQSRFFWAERVPQFFEICRKKRKK